MILASIYNDIQKITKIYIQSGWPLLQLYSTTYSLYRKCILYLLEEQKKPTMCQWHLSSQQYSVPGTRSVGPTRFLSTSQIQVGTYVPGYRFSQSM